MSFNHSKTCPVCYPKTKCPICDCKAGTCSPPCPRSAGDGYTLLCEADVLQDGDEWWERKAAAWLPMVAPYTGKRIGSDSFLKTLVFRRRVAAHEVPFAFNPNVKIVERFLVQIETQEQPNYCGCQSCRSKRGDIWASIMRALVLNKVNGADPFKVFPEKHEIIITREP